MNPPIRFSSPIYLTALVIAIAGFITPLRADERIGIDLTINNSTVHFAMDTGADTTVIFRGTAKRLGLKVIPTKSEAMPPDRIHLDLTEECLVSFAGKSQKMSLFVVDDQQAGRPDMDGVLSWNDLLSSGDDVTLIDADKHNLLSIPIPNDIEKWTKWKIVPNVSGLMFVSKDGQKIGIDTGKAGGVFLSATMWRKWFSQRSKQPATFEAVLSPAEGLVIKEVLRARKISVGGLVLDDMPVTLSQVPSEGSVFKGYDAIIGLYALHQMEVIIDRKHGVLYTLRNSTVPAPYNYNRLGAIFVPKDLENGKELFAHVAAGSPAYKAGIRNDDVLEKIDDLDVTKWRTDPKVLPLGRFWSQTAGTVIHLFLKRGDHPYDVSVTLKEVAPVD